MSIAHVQTPILRVHFLDVGYGDSILIQFPSSKTLLIDAGYPQYSEKIFSYLSNLSIKKLDGVILTHSHENHFGGLQGLVGRLPIAQVWINGDSRSDAGYEDLLSKFRAKSIAIAILKRGDTLSHFAEKAIFEVFHPSTFSEDINSNSLVIKFTWSDASFLFTGDISQSAQDQLAKTEGERLHATVIQIPHHGVPISETFSKSFKASFYVISTGPSKWLLPDSEELKRLQGTVLRTDTEGSIIFESNGKKLERVQGYAGV